MEGAASYNVSTTLMRKGKAEGSERLGPAPVINSRSPCHQWESLDSKPRHQESDTSNKSGQTQAEQA